MQINSVHLPELAKYGITEKQLFDPCTNITVGAWLLSQRQTKYGNTWEAVGTYHSKTPSRKWGYAVTRSVNSDIRKFVSYSPAEESPSAVATVLTCAQGVAGVGSFAKGATKAAEALKLKGVLTSKGYKDATALMGLLDTDLMYGKKTFNEISESVGKFSSSGAAMMAKLFYDKVQQANDINGLASAVLDSL